MFRIFYRLPFLRDMEKNSHGAPLLVDLFLYSYEAKIIQGLIHEKKKEITRCSLQRDI